MDLVFYQIGQLSVYQHYLVTSQLIGSNGLRRKNIPQINLTSHTCELKCIPGGYLMKLVERMLRVCKAVIKVEGDNIEETQI
jgi:hypothetical protein